MKKEIEEAVIFLKEHDPVMENVIKKAGVCSLEKSDNYHRNLVRSIISQQISVSAARAILGRFEMLINADYSPECIMNAKHEELRKAGLSDSKAKYIKNISEYFINNTDFKYKAENMTNSEIIDELTSIKGVGIWTAQMFLIFSMGRLDVLPYQDAGFRRSVKKHYGIAETLSDKHIKLISENWSVYSSVAVWYLWRGIDD